MWNLAMAEVAEEELREARELLARVEPEEVRYIVGRGDLVSAISGAAVDVGAGCVIVRSERTRRVPVVGRRSLASRLATGRPFTVMCPPPAP
jgi:hypothetical protein